MVKLGRCGGKIVCKNTLDIDFRKKLPQVWDMFFSLELLKPPGHDPTKHDTTNYFQLGHQSFQFKHS
ncbi:hypothetical protein F2Q68_00016612 [Brassica cretica]|uniref:Uncharacterized protein n=1 Tax=Brassica cretica TaxID=69181 RepID=A0A8S9HHL3_BRACR|nr:hypothetical protein F2Q68_00016612 [Brassica cretica]